MPLGHSQRHQQKRFVQGYAKLIAPLVHLTSFVWGGQQDKAFKALQDCLCRAPVLAMTEIGAPYEVVYDASGLSSS